MPVRSNGGVVTTNSWSDIHISDGVSEADRVWRIAVACDRERRHSDELLVRYLQH